MNIKKHVRKFLHLLKKAVSPCPSRSGSGKVEISFQVTVEQRQMIGSVIEKSGVRGMPELLANSLSLFEKSVDHELNGGTIEFVEPNGVNRETLELLRHLNGDDEFWKEE